MGRYFTFFGSSSARMALACGVAFAASTWMPLRAEEAVSQAPPASELQPTRHELWVPTKDLKEVLKNHPNAVMLDSEQYAALIRDAGRVGPLKEQVSPISAVIEEVKVTARVPADMTMATITYEFHIHNLRDGWSTITMPFALGGIAGGTALPSSGSSTLRDVMLIDMSAEKPIMVSVDENAWKTTVLSQGNGRHVLRLVFASPVYANDGALRIYGPGLTEVIWKEGTKGKQPSAPVPSVPVRLELPAEWKPSSINPSTRLDDGAWLVSSGMQFWSAPSRNAYRPFPMLKVDWEPVVGVAKSADSVIQAQATMLYRISGDRVGGAAAVGWSGAQARGSETLRITLPKEAQVLRATIPGSPADVTDWRPVDGGVEFQSPAMAKSTGKVLIEFEMPWGGVSGAVHPLELPLVRMEGAVATKWDVAILAEPDIGVRLTKLLPSARPLTEFDKHTLRVLAQGVTKGVGVGAQFQAEPNQDLFNHPRFLGAFSFDAPPDQPVVEVQMVPDRFSVDADALVEVTSHEVGVVRTLALHGEAGSTSRAVITLPESEVFLEMPVTAGEHVLWKQVGRDIEVTWPRGLGKGEQTSLTIRTRRDIPPAAADGTAAEKVVIGSLPVSGASRVSGYVALKFDESWKVNVTDTTGLEMRDARATPVRGRMAWFGLKDWKLGFDLSRRSPVHDATVTAYALPRAKQVEIEGQIALSVSGAPLRKFQVKLPVAIAPLLRVTSPLVGEQSLDAATGVWTLTLGRELIGTANVRFRMSLPAENATEGSGEGTLTAALPDITLPGARRMAGRWVVEANTDTELAFTTRGVQPIDSRRPPSVEGYSPQHRIIAAYSHGGGEHEIRLTATRHDPAELAGMVLIYLRMTSVLGQDGSARHEAIFTLRHNGRQFATIRLPEGAGLLSTMVDGKVVKPVKAGANEVRLPLASRIGDSSPVEVKVMYDTPFDAWGGSGRLALTPPTLGNEVPVMETQWKMYTPAGFTLRQSGSGLEEVPVSGYKRQPGGLWDTLFGWTRLRGPSVEKVDFLPGGEAPDEMIAFQQRETAKGVIVDRASKIILPSVKFDGASVEEAIEYLRLKSREYDQMESDPGRRGINIIMKPGGVPSTSTITLDLKDVPLSEALRYITELGGMAYRIEPPRGPGMAGTIVIIPVTDVGTEMYTRTFKLPLAHLLKLKEQARQTRGTAGYNAAEKQTGDVSELEALKSFGIRFPEGAEASYDSDAQTLFVRNTQPSLDLVESALFQFAPQKSMSDYYEFGDELKETPANRYGLVSTPGEYYRKKMPKIIFPTVKFQGASVEEAIEFLRIKSGEFDNVEPDPNKKGVNLIVKPGSAPSTATISLDLKDVPMSEALRFVTELGGMKYTVEPYAVVVVPISDVSTEMYTRTFKLPPDFLEAHEDDVQPENLDILKASGIPFAEATSATYLPETNELIVRNTEAQLALIERYVNKRMTSFLEKRRNALRNRSKSGLVPLELELPAHGEMLALKGNQRPGEVTVYYLSWERQMARSSLLALLGATLFWALRNVRIWFYTFIVVLLLVFGPILIVPSWTAEFSALLAGWMMALGIWIFWKIAHWWRARTGPLENSNEKEVMA